MFVAKEWTRKRQCDKIRNEAHNQITKIGDDIEIWCEKNLVLGLHTRVLNFLGEPRKSKDLK